MADASFAESKGLFQEALDRPCDERAALLSRACAGRPALRREVESLLRAALEEGHALSRPLFGEPPDRAPGPHPLEGQELGAYRVLRLLGQGGMGAVFLAARTTDFEQRVAIKVVKRGMDTDFILQRFRSERQILARLDHPHIARLLSGGATADGLPYFVMEHIDGQPIDEFCQARGLRPAERLGLFRAVCAAVHYAHQNLVVHRDLKPGNILVSREGCPKLLDFGIAKLLGPEPSETGAQAPRLLTPEYASPEQVRGDPITTASDVYSLGAVLHDLIAGRPDEGHPRRPESVPGDLGTIVAMALRAEPQLRYASAQQLLEDIDRLLAGRPVIARRDTLSYRTRKLVERNKLLCGLSALLLLALLGGVLATRWQAQVARRERARAERRFQDVRKLAHTFLFEFHDAIAPLPGATPARELLVRRALAYLHDLAQENDDVTLLRELVDAYEKIGDVQGNPRNANLGDARGALQSYGQALALAERLAAHSGDREDLRRIAVQEQKLGDMHWELRQFPEALARSRRALARQLRLRAQQAGDLGAAVSIADLHAAIGDIYLETGQAAQALAEYREQLSAMKDVLRGAPVSPEHRRKLSIAHNKVGGALLKAGAREEALAHYREALQLRRALSAERPGHAGSLRDLSTSLTLTGKVLRQLERWDEALDCLKEGLGIDEELARLDPRNAQARRDVCITYSRLGELYANQLGDKEDARREALRASARGWFQRSREGFVAMQKDGVLRAGDEVYIAQLGELIAAHGGQTRPGERAGRGGPR